MYDPNDPYRYGAPQQFQQPYQPVHQVPLTGTRATGREILAATWQLLRQDRSLLALPVLSAVAALIAGGLLFAPGWAIGRAIGQTNQAGGAVGTFLAAFAMSFVAIFFQAALVIGANERADGGDPTLGGVIEQAWRLKGKIFAWALLTTTVGMVLRAAEERLGVLGKILGFFAGLGWAIASFFAVPVIVAEQLGPIDAVKRSGAVIRQTWGSSLRTTLRFGVIQFLLTIPCVVAIIAGIVIMANGTAAMLVLGGLVLLAGIVALTALAVIASAVTTYARALIYRFATGRPVPGMPSALLAGAFMAKSRRG